MRYIDKDIKRSSCSILLSVLLTLVIPISVANAKIELNSKTLKSKSIPPVIVQAQVDKAKATTSDTIAFTITLDAIKEIKVDLPQFGGEIQGFRITDFETIGPKAEDDRMITKRIYKLQADLAGTYILPKIAIQYQDSNKKQQTVKTSEIFVEIESRLKKDGDDKEPRDIRDIKGLATLPYKMEVWEIILIISVLVVLGIFAYIWYRTSRPRSELKIPPVPPHTLALQRLKELEQMTLPESNWEQSVGGGALEKRFHFALSEITREYFEGIFAIQTTDMTTEEIKKRVIPLTGISDQLKNNFLDLLHLTDLVKFTDSCFGLPKSRELLDEAKNFVSKTRPADANLKADANKDEEKDEDKDKDKDKDKENSEDNFI